MGNGTLLSPYTAQEALSGTRIGAGSVVWLRGGIYAGGLTTLLKGTPGRPITFRSYPGELAIIDAGAAMVKAIDVQSGAADLTFRDVVFQATASEVSRWAEVTGSIPSLARGFPPFSGSGTSRVKWINYILRNTGNSATLTMLSADSEMYGGIHYYNGWDASDRAHGPATYQQNSSAANVNRDLVLWGNGNIGARIYSEREGTTEHILFEGVTVFRNRNIGLVHNDGVVQEVLFGNTEATGHDATLSNSMVWSDPDAGYASFGYSKGIDGVQITNNFLAVPTVYSLCYNLVATGNKALAPFEFTGYGTPAGNDVYASDPVENWVLVRPNLYRDSGTLRANSLAWKDPRVMIVSVINWANADTHVLDLAPYIASGLIGAAETIVARDAQNLMRPTAQIEATIAEQTALDPAYRLLRTDALGPVVATRSGDSITLPLDLTAIEAMDGLAGTFTQPAHTPKNGIHCFVLEAN